MSINFGVIGGTGVYNPKMLTSLREVTVDTPYGNVQVKIGVYQNKEIAFLARHGFRHSVPPHAINYQANIMALKKLGVKKIIATAAVGSLNPSMVPGDFVLIDQFIDFTKGRKQTFFEEGKVLHIDMTEPYCPHLRKVIQENCPQEITLHSQGTYVCTEGPRFETPAEIRMFQMWGGDVVGMTSVPEVILARELGMCYATIATVTNFAAGISPNPLTHEEVKQTLAENGANLQKLIINSLEDLDEIQNCLCAEAYKEAGNLG